MTLILTVNGPETIWILADRRLSRKGRPSKDDARKVMFLVTDDGEAILGYAGLGATARGTEPSDWMSAVLRGRRVPLEQSLGILANALKAQFPRHMGGVPAHHVVVPAFVNNEARLYTIEFQPSRAGDAFRCARQVGKNSTRPPRFAIVGSGAPYLIQNQKKWVRGLLRVLKACDRRQVSELAVADHLANLNNEVHLNDKSVGPRCLVAWRHRKGGARNGGGSEQFYTGTVRDTNSPMLPSILCGGDVVALMGVTMARYTKMFQEALRTGQPPQNLSNDEVNVELARLPDTPDENLR